MIASGIVTGAIAGAVVAALMGVIARSRGSRLVPQLPEPDEHIAVTGGDRARYYAANVVAGLLGLAAVGVLYLVAPPTPEPRTFTPASGVGWFLGPFFLVLSIGAATSPTLLRLMVAPGPLSVLVYQRSAKAGHKDFRRLSVLMGVVVGCLALALHVSLGSFFLRLEDDGVRWQNHPFAAEQFRTWEQVSEVRIVRTFEAMTGKVVDRPHLAILFDDGELAVHGRQDTHPPEQWEEAAAFAAEKAGVPVRRVDK